MEKEQVTQSFIRILNWAGNQEARNYGIEQKLYLTEIHTLAAIYHFPGIVQRNLCEEIGVTKGRMSVIIRNLVKKQLVVKTVNKENKREMPLYLTENGRIACEHHEEHEKQMLDSIEKLLEECTKEELDKADYIFNEIAKILQR